MEPILLKAVDKTLIWGHEQWGICAHPNGDNVVLNPEYAGMSLSELWSTRPELFGRIDGDRFPLLTKIIDARTDLSIQVHPDGEYARVNENGSLGKTECWYVMDAEPGATIVIGHNAADRDQVVSMIEGKRWSEFIREIPVCKGDFFFIEPGTVHSIKGGTVILETQQSSDITYRVYDYDRLQDGKPRPLHIKQSIDVIKAPFVEKDPPLDGCKSIGDVRQLVSCDCFTVWHGVVDGELVVDQCMPFILCSVIDGSVLLDDKRMFHKGEHFILPAGYGKAVFKGQGQVILSSI